MAGAHDELELKMLEEHKRERERENIMKQVRFIRRGRGAA
jgi:hypothetical protein